MWKRTGKWIGTTRCDAAKRPSPSAPTFGLATSTRPQWFRYSFIYVEITIYFNSVRKFNDLFTITIIFLKLNNKRKRSFYWNFIYIYIKNFDEFRVLAAENARRELDSESKRRQDTRSRKFMISHTSSIEIWRALGLWILKARWPATTPYSVQATASAIAKVLFLNLFGSPSI